MGRCRSRAPLITKTPGESLSSATAHYRLSLVAPADCSQGAPAVTSFSEEVIPRALDRSASSRSCFCCG
jgi:hypothetical protein